MVMYLGQGADLRMSHLMPLPLTISCSSKFRLVLPSWFYLSAVGSPGYSRAKSKRIINGMVVCVCVCVCVCRNLVILYSTLASKLSAELTNILNPFCQRQKPPMMRMILTTREMWNSRNSCDDTLVTFNICQLQSLQSRFHWPF